MRSACGLKSGVQGRAEARAPLGVEALRDAGPADALPRRNRAFPEGEREVSPSCAVRVGEGTEDAFLNLVAQKICKNSSTRLDLMKLLTDTNILIPAEPTRVDDVTSLTSQALRLQSLAQGAPVTLCIHPGQRKDIARDRDASRRRLRQELFARYFELVSPPPIQEALRNAIGAVGARPNDEVDDNLLAAVFGNAVNYLVTEDRAIHRKAARAGIARRVLLLSEATAILEALFDPAPQPPPTVDSIPAYSLDDRDPIFGSFRLDYGNQFDSWHLNANWKGGKAGWCGKTATTPP